MTKTRLRVTLVGASVLRESELPGFEDVSDFASDSYNLAIALLKASTAAEQDLAEHVDITLLDCSIGWDNKTLGDAEVRAVLDTQPDVVGLSCYCWSIDTLLDLAAKVSRAAPRVFILLGGPSAGPIAKDLFELHPWIDAVASGEGELTFTTLMRSLLREADLSAVPGLVYRDALGLPIASVAPDLAVDLSRLPSVYRTAVVQPKASMLLETSRGCRFRCRFCSWMGGGRTLRYVPIEAIEADLRWALEHGVRDIKIADTAINFHTERLLELTDAVRRADPDKKLRFTYFLKSELLTEEQVACLRGIPTREIIIGVESLTSEARRSIGKPPFDPLEFERTLDLLQDVGPVTASLILGLPGDTEEGLCKTLDCITAFDDTHPRWLHVIILFWLAILPGSSLHAKRKEHGYRYCPVQTPYALESQHLGPDSLLVMARQSVERHYQHPKLRVEYFQKEYLMQDAPESERHTIIARRSPDSRPCVVLAALVDPAQEAFLGVRPYSLPIAWMKAYAEADGKVRNGWRLELMHIEATGEGLGRNVERIGLLAPRAVLLTTSSSGGIPRELLRQLRAALPDAKLVVHGQFDCDEGLRLLESEASVDAVLAGEPEEAFRGWLAQGLEFSGLGGYCHRSDGRLVSGAPAVEVPELDRIPSPLQWGFIQRPGSTIAMQWSRYSAADQRPRFFSPQRIYGDMRWAIEQRHDHIVWLDPSLPVEQGPLVEFVAAVRRADPDGRVRHSYTLAPAACTHVAVELLGRLPAREIRLTDRVQSSDQQVLLDLLCQQTGARLSPVDKDLAVKPPLHSFLHPWRVGAALEGWTLQDIASEPGAARAVRIHFLWAGQQPAAVLLERAQQGLQPPWRASLLFPQLDRRPPDQAIKRLTQMISSILSRRPDSRQA